MGQFNAQAVELRVSNLGQGLSQGHFVVVLGKKLILTVTVPLFIQEYKNGYMYLTNFLEIHMRCRGLALNPVGV